MRLAEAEAMDYGASGRDAYVPCAVEVERARAADGDEAEHVAVEAQGALERPAHDGDVVKRSQREAAAALHRRLDALRVHHLPMR